MGGVCVTQGGQGTVSFHTSCLQECEEQLIKHLCY